MAPERARVVVVGGGVIGCSCLYHLAKQGWTDSVLVEQFQLTHGSTWHSAGLVGQLRSSISLTRMMQYSVGLYTELKELTGNDPGWHQLGGMEPRDGRGAAAETDRGRLECEVVVDAAGMYARQVAALVGVDVPIVPFGHQYLNTAPFDPPLEPLPTLRDPNSLVYFRT